MSTELGYDANGNRVSDVARTMDADDHGTYLDRTYAYTFDPRDRVAGVEKTDTSSGSALSTEAYVHDAASNVISQTVEGVTTSFVYDRNRLLTATSAGVVGTYNYDPFGRLDTVTSAGLVVERYTYDGFDRVASHRSLESDGSSSTTSYAYDPMDRTASRTSDAGAAGEETTEFSYLGLSGEVLSEEVAGQIQTSYQYSPWGQRLSQIKYTTDGGRRGSRAYTPSRSTARGQKAPSSTFWADRRVGLHAAARPVLATARIAADACDSLSLDPARLRSAPT